MLAKYNVDDVERLFSMSKRIFSTKRRSLAPVTVEALMFLNKNRELWNIALVGSIINETMKDSDN